MEPRATLRPFEDRHLVSDPVAEGKQAGFKATQLEVKLDDDSQSINSFAKNSSSNSQILGWPLRLQHEKLQHIC